MDQSWPAFRVLVESATTRVEAAFGRPQESRWPHEWYSRLVVAIQCCQQKTDTRKITAIGREIAVSESSMRVQSSEENKEFEQQKDRMPAFFHDEIEYEQPTTYQRPRRFAHLAGEPLADFYRSRSWRLDHF